MGKEEVVMVALPRSFYERPPDVVAPALLGKVLVSRVGDVTLAGRIVEAEAYLGPHCEPVDKAAHSHRGPTPRNRVLFGAAGHAYVYSIYGQYFCMNVSCEPEGSAGCVLLRALEPLDGIEAMARNRGVAVQEATERFLRGLTSGPSRLCMALGIARATHNGVDLTDAESHRKSGLAIVDDGFVAGEMRVTARIGINEANEARDWPLRFCLAGSGFVSGPRLGARLGQRFVARRIGVRPGKNVVAV
jgi:DNA-3-methyladenine glycosylase